MGESQRHNTVLRPILDLIVRDNDRIVDESEALVILESVAVGLMRLYRSNPLHAAEYLDVLTERVLERMRA